MPYTDPDARKAYAKAYREQHREARRAYTEHNRDKLNAQQREWARAHPEYATRQRTRYQRLEPEQKALVIARVGAWKKANPEKRRQYSKTEYARFKERGVKKVVSADDKRRYHIKHRYGLTLEQHHEMLESQRGGCAICSVPPKPGKWLHVDHDHATGEVRGLLCARCNLGMGLYDQPGFFAAAEAYAKNHRRSRLALSEVAS